MGYISDQASHIGTINKTSEVGEDLVQTSNIDPKYTSKCFLKLQLIVESSCDFLVNNVDTITVTPTYGLMIDYEDINIYSLKTLTAGVGVYGAYFY